MCKMKFILILYTYSIDFMLYLTYLFWYIYFLNIHLAWFQFIEDIAAS